MISNRVADKLRDLFRGEQGQGETRMVGEVLGVDDDGTAWVHVFGGAERTPVSATSVQLSKGNLVNLYVGDGRAEVIGNMSDPAPTMTQLRRVRLATQEAIRIASETSKAADATNQHFWSDGNGVHVAEATNEEWQAEPSGRNVLLNSLGILFRAALDNIVTMTQSAVAFWDGGGNEESNVTATFGRSGILFSSSVPQRIGGDDSYIEWVDTDDDEVPDTLNVVASHIVMAGVQVATSSDLSDAVSEIDEAIDGVQEEIEPLTSYIDVQLGQNPSMELGSESGAKARLDADSLDFMTSDREVVASIGIDDDGEGRLMGTRATFTQDLSIGEGTTDTGGYWRWEQRSNGNLCLKWIGAS